MIHENANRLDTSSGSLAKDTPEVETNLVHQSITVDRTWTNSEIRLLATTTITFLPTHHIGTSFMTTTS